MWIERLRVRNFKSFRDQQEISLTRGFNVIVGQNNAGKSALIEAMSLRFFGEPHKSIRTQPKPQSPIDPTSSVDMDVRIAGADLRDVALGEVRPSQVSIPLKESDRADQETASGALAKYFSLKEIPFAYTWQAVRNQYPQSKARACPDYDGSLVFFTATRSCAQFGAAQDRQSFQFLGGNNISSAENYANELAPILRDRCYCFRAERMNITTCPNGVNSVLAPDASNLAEVLHFLFTSDPREFRDYVNLIRKVFPQIAELSIRLRQDAPKFVEIVYWPDEEGAKFGHLALELSKSGTGIGQVLAILYVVSSAKYPRTIAIDEPGSFLHPAAAKKLIEVLRDYPKHQYIISTHSPEIIRAADPATVTLLRHEGGQSVVTQLSMSAYQGVKTCLDELGVRLSDVFGADKVLWVEGKTEVDCFTRIMGRQGRRVPAGVSIVPLIDTMGIGYRHRTKRKVIDLALKIYSVLSTANALVPQAIAFEFDREELSDQDVKDLERGQYRIEVLPRRMIENYLLNADAICFVLGQRLRAADVQLNKELVKGRLATLGGLAKYFGSAGEVPAYGSQAWLQGVDGASLMQDLFSDLSTAKYEYRKASDAGELIDWLLSNDPGAIAELIQFVDGLHGASM